MREGRAALLPPASPGWPAVLFADEATPDVEASAALLRIRRDALFWPAPRAAATHPRCLALTARDLAAARAAFDDVDILCAADPAEAAPDRLEAVFGPAGAPALLWARMGGLSTPCGERAEDAAALLAL